MDISPVVSKALQLVDAYGGGGFRLSGQSFDGSVLINGAQALNWPVTELVQATAESFAPLLQSEARPELLVIGCGAHFAQIPPAIRDFFKMQRIGIEAMDTGGACRTFNILAAEGRRVAAALIAV